MTQCRQCGADVRTEDAMVHHQYNWHDHENILKFATGEQVTLFRLPDKDNMLQCPNTRCRRLIAARKTMKHHIETHCLFVLQSRYQKRQQSKAVAPTSLQSTATSRSRPQQQLPSFKKKSSRSTHRPVSLSTTTAIATTRPSNQNSTIICMSTTPKNTRPHPYHSARPKHTPANRHSTSAPDSFPPSTTQFQDDAYLALIKQEGTILEIDFNEVDEGVHWTNVGDEIMMMESVQPTVELHEVPKRVKRGEEVRAKCRIGQLGKFAVTSTGLTLGFELIPVKKIGAKKSNQQQSRVKARVEAGVIETLLSRPASELTRMVTTKNMVEFQKVVRELRDHLENLGPIECRFQGMRDDAVIVRELVSTNDSSRIV